MKTPKNLSPGASSEIVRKGLSILMAASALVAVILFAASCSDDDAAPAAELTITSITPTTGDEGTEVEINGTGFSATAAQNAVTLNGKTCPVVDASTTQLTVTIPANAGSGNIIVTVNGKSAQSATFSFIPPLSVTSIEPNSGGTGTIVVITGTGFSPNAANNVVTINGKPVTVNNATTTQLNVTIPSAAGNGALHVTVGGVTVESSTFTFVFTIEVSTLAGSTSGFAEGTGTAAQFNQPYNVATDADGNVYVADASNHRIRKITPAGVVTTLAGGTQGDAEGTGEEAQFNYPYCVATDDAGNVFVADTHNHKIKKITPAGVVTTIAGSTGGYTDATGSNAQFYYPTGLALDGEGNIIVADKDNHKVRKVTPAGVVTTLAGAAPGFADGTGTAAQFSSPYDVAVDEDGNAFIADASNHKIRKITPDGVTTTLAGGGQGDAEGTGAAAQFYYPFGIAIDHDGNLFVADTYNHKVKKVTSAGVVTTIAGTTGGSDDGAPTVAKFNYPTGIDVASDGVIYIGDKDNHRVRKITAD